MITRALTAALVPLLLVASALAARADDTRPATLVIEQDGRETYAVRWQTPMRGGDTLRLSPRLPEGTERIDGTYERGLMGDSLLETWRVRVPGGLVGREIGIAGPAAVSRGAITTVRLRGGVVHRAVLSGSRPTLTVPQPVLEAREHPGEVLARAARDGVELGHGAVHVLLVVLLALAAGWRALGWPLTAFLLADIAGALLPWRPASGELGTALIALAAVLVAREALREVPRRLVALAALAGLACGVSGTQHEVARALGTDLAHLAIGVGAAFLATRRLPGLLRYAAVAVPGVLAAALAVGHALAPSPVLAREAGAAPIAPMGLVASGTPQAPRTRAVEGMDVFLDIGVFETRVELLGRYEVLAAWLDLRAAGAVDTDVLSVDAQADLLARARRALAGKLEVTFDGDAVAPREVRAAFTTRDAAGVYFREAPVDEVPGEAVLGIVCFYAQARIPGAAEVVFADLPDAPLAGRVLDPEVSRDAPLSRERPFIQWDNELSADPLPPIESLAVRREPVEIPAWSLAMLVLGSVVVMRGGRTPVVRIALARAVLAVAVLVAGGERVAVPGMEGTTPAPTPAEQRAIAGTLLDNVYRAFNERGEEEVYDRLALSLVGDRLAGAYVENRRVLEERRFGGARTHVDVVELHALEGAAPREGGGFAAEATWTVSGTVTHFGHRHLRRNRYEAALEIAPIDGAWKIRVLDVRATTREK